MSATSESRPPGVCRGLRDKCATEAQREHIPQADRGVQITTEAGCREQPCGEHLAIPSDRAMNLPYQMNRIGASAADAVTYILGFPNVGAKSVEKFTSTYTRTIVVCFGMAVEK